MKKIVLTLFLPFFIYAGSIPMMHETFFDFSKKKIQTVDKKAELEKCYNKGHGSSECGKELALILKKTNEERAAEIFLDLSLKGDVESTRELALLYIYGKKIKQDCRKGIYILLNAADGRSDKKQSTLAFKEISKLFKNGICVEKDEIKAKKYNDVYMKRIKKELKDK